MKLKKEFLIGIVTLVGISVLIVGSFFLKGQEIWKSRFVYYSVFSNSEGLSTGRPVNLNGLQVGIITNINFQKNNLNNIVVEFELTDPNVFKLKKGSLVLLNSDLLSGSYLDISYGDSLDYYNSRDTIPSSVSLALEDQINERLIPLEKKTNELISTCKQSIGMGPIGVAKHLSPFLLGALHGKSLGARRGSCSTRNGFLEEFY